MAKPSFHVIVLFTFLSQFSFASIHLSEPSSPFGPMPDFAETIRPLAISTKPIIDGVFDEPFWKQAPSVTGFKTFIPDFDKIPDEQTQVAVAYDEENLYFGYRCFDKPENIKASLSARDKMFADDFVCINLDAQNDQQGLYAFYVNPLGVQGDSRFAAGMEDFSPDYVWYSAGRIDSIGYTVEVQIPLKSLRYADNNPTTMGMIFERNISRRGEHSTFPRLDPAKGFALLTQMKPVEYENIKHYKLFELLPAFTATRQDVRKQGNLVSDKQESNASLNIKYGITSDLILDGTLNPDFSQIESDAGQVDINLRNSLFYPEKRTFFLEGQDNFNIASNANMFDPTIYYSRTIADPFIGTKLTGQVGTGNTIAALYAVDNVIEQDRATLGDYVRVPVVRYKRTLTNDSYVGLLYAGRELDKSNNRVVGFDESYRISDGDVIESNGFLSWTKDNPTSTLNGNTFGFRYFHGDRDMNYSFSFRDVSKDFRADMGYISRTGLTNFVGYFNPRIYFNNDVLQRIGFELISANTKDKFSELWETGNDLAVNVYFTGTWMFRTRLNYSTEIFNNDKFQTSGVHFSLNGQISKQASVGFLVRRTKAIFYPTAEQGRSNTENVNITLNPWDNIRVEGSFTYSDFTSDATDAMLYHLTISRLKLTYQFNQYLFFRAIGEYNSFRKQLSNDLLASFTYIPGTVVYLGYGSVFNKVQWDSASNSYVANNNLLEMRRGLFLKMSYLWRM